MQLLRVIPFLSGVWEDDQGRRFVVSPDQTFELFNRDRQRELAGRLEVEGDHIKITTVTRADRPVQPETQKRYRLRMREAELHFATIGEEASDDAKLGSTLWRRQG